MEPHRRILGILNLVWGALGVLSGIIVLAILGGVASLLGLIATDEPGAAIAIPILGLVGTFVFSMAIILAIPSLAAGYGLVRERPWATTVGVVVSALHLLNIPFGTVLGVYGLWVLMPRGAPPQRD